MPETVLTRAFFENREDLLGFLKARLQCPATAEDLCQDIYLKVQSVEEPEAIANCRSYLFMIAANLAADALRTQTRRSSLLHEGKDIALPVAENLTPEEQLVARAEIDHLNRAVEALPELTRQIFYASRLQNLTQREIAAQFEVSLSTVEYHIRKVLDHLARAREAFHRQT